MTEPLPPRQFALLVFLHRQMRTVGVVPSLAEISDHFGFQSQTAAVHLLAKLEAKGVIERESGARRAIRLLWPDPTELAQAAPRLFHRVPYLGRIAAGTPITAGFDAAELAEKYVDIDPSLFAVLPSCCHDVKGDSMIKEGIHSGDRVFASYRENFRSGQIVSALIVDPLTNDPGFTVKVYERNRSIITLHSRNDDLETYKPMRFNTDKDFIQVMGVFSGLIRGVGA